MRKLSLLLIVAIAAAASLAQPVLAQDRAAEVLAGMRKAIGAGKLESLRTFSLEATTARNIGERQLTTDVELYLDLPDKYLRVENVTAPIARTMTSGFNGDTVITAAGGAMGGGMPMVITHTAVGGGGGGAMVTQRIEMAGGGRAGGTGEMTPEQRAMMNASIIRSQRVDLSRLMLGWFGMAHPALKATYTYAGEAESPDGKAHVISIKADGGFDAKLFIDQATNMPLMLTYEAPEPMRITRGGPAGAPAGAPIVSGGGGMRGGGAGAAPPPPPPPPPGGAQQMTQEEIQKQIEAMRSQPRKMIEHRVYFGDWKEVDGIQFPHSLQRATGDTTTEEWTISKVKVNPKIDAKKFQ